jgi:2'-5' RNA ligase
LAAIDQASLGAPFELVLGEMGAFPKPARATVLWLGVVQGFSRLSELNAVCEQAAQAAGLSPEDRPYAAHLTLSRIRPHQDVQSVIDAYQPIPLTWQATELVLYESTRRRTGAVYDPVASFAF